MGVSVRSSIARGVSIPFSARSNGRYGIILVPQWARKFFREGYKVVFDLRTPVGSTKANLTSAPRGTPRGADAGAYLCGGIRRVFRQHRDWRIGMWLNFERRKDHILLTCSRQPKFYART